MLARSLTLLGLFVAACNSAPAYVCQTNVQCVDQDGASGICEPDGACSFVDLSCTTTSRRFADGAANGKGGTCVAPLASSCVSDLAAGDQHFCFVRSDSTIWCWGQNDVGQLGDGTTTNRSRPVQVRTPAGKSFLEVRLSENHTCAVATDDTVWCWGANDVGQLGVVDVAGTPAADSPLPVQVKAVTGTVAPFTLTPFLAKHISAGGKHVCAVSSDGGLYCWGENADGQCAAKPPSAGGTADDLFSPTLVPGLSEGVVGVAVGDENSACLKDDGSVYEFGGNANGQLGNGTTTDSYLPVKAKITSVTAITGGDENMCAVKNDGSVWCWGYGVAVGLDGGADQSTPQRILTATSTWSGGSAFHMCAVQSSALLCWGQNDQGQVGIGSIDPASSTIGTPTPALITTVAHAAAGTSDTCAVTSEGQLWCWGANDKGQLAQGSMGEASAVPLRVAVSCN